MSNVIWTPDGDIITVRPVAKKRPKVTILNCWNAEKFPFPVPVISFNEWTQNGEQRAYPLQAHHKDVQRIFCDDIESEIDASYRMFDYIDAIKILSFLDKYRGEDIMVHCSAGVSRSPATGKFMIDYLGYEIDPFNDHDDFFKCHNTHIYYTLKRAILDHPSMVERIKEANHG